MYEASSLTVEAGEAAELDEGDAADEAAAEEEEEAADEAAEAEGLAAAEEAELAVEELSSLEDALELAAETIADDVLLDEPSPLVPVQPERARAKTVKAAISARAKRDGLRVDWQCVDTMYSLHFDNRIIAELFQSSEFGSHM